MASAVRLKMVQNEDPRAIRTRERLTGTYRRLVDEGQAPTSVSAVTTRARVNRSSFYTHFADLDELALYSLDRFLVGLAERDTQIRQSRSGAEAVRASVLDFVTHVANERSVFMNVFELGAGGAALNRLIDLVARRFRALLLRVARDVDPVKNDLTARFIAAGVCGAVGIWLSDESGELSADQLTDHLLTLFPVSFF